MLAGAGRCGADIEVATVTNAPADAVVASQGLVVEPAATLGTPDLPIVPRGSWTDGVRREYEAGRLPTAVANRHDAGSTVAPVGTGAMLLPAGGLLDGRPAPPTTGPTTPWQL